MGKLLYIIYKFLLFGVIYWQVNFIGLFILCIWFLVIVVLDMVIVLVDMFYKFKYIRVKLLYNECYYDMSDL